MLRLVDDNSAPVSTGELCGASVPELHELSPEHLPSTDYYTPSVLAAQYAEPERPMTQQQNTVPVDTPVTAEIPPPRSSHGTLGRNHNTTEPRIADHAPISPTPGGPSDSGGRDSSTVFADLDGRIAKFMFEDPSLGCSSSAAEGAIKTLHSLPGGARALLYEFGSSSRSDWKNTEDPTTNRRFRCPFDIVHPGAQRHGLSCQGPGYYPLGDLWCVLAPFLNTLTIPIFVKDIPRPKGIQYKRNGKHYMSLTIPRLHRDHLEQHHRSYDCCSCLEDCRNSAGIMSHISRGCVTPPTLPPNGIPFIKFQEVREALVDVGKKNGVVTPRVEEQEERWNNMWDILFPMFSEQRPSPCQLSWFYFLSAICF